HQRLDRPGPWTKDHRARLTLGRSDRPGARRGSPSRRMAVAGDPARDDAREPFGPERVPVPSRRSAPRGPGSTPSRAPAGDPRRSRAPRPDHRAGPSGRPLVGFYQDVDHVLARLRTAQEADKTLVFQMSGDILQGPEMIARLILGRDQQEED